MWPARRTRRDCWSECWSERFRSRVLSAEHGVNYLSLPPFEPVATTLHGKHVRLGPLGDEHADGLLAAGHCEVPFAIIDRCNQHADRCDEMDGHFAFQSST